MGNHWKQLYKKLFLKLLLIENFLEKDKNKNKIDILWMIEALRKKLKSTKSKKPNYDFLFVKHED